MLYLFGIIVWGVVWGFATRTVVYNKGYDENWFWWGFFFGFIALIVACAKPDNHYTAQDAYYEQTVKEIGERDILNAGGWRCTCGRLNASYVSSCTCGKSKWDIRASEEEKKRVQELAEQESEAEKKVQSEADKIAALKEYRELMNSGIISEEEFEAKKKQLLG